MRIITFSYFVFVFGLMSFTQSDTVPYKPEIAFDVKFDLSFRQRPPNDKINLSETRSDYEKRTNTSPVPYAKIQVVFKKLELEEVRVRIIQDERLTIISRKAEPDVPIVIDAGFLDDVRDHVRGYQYEVLLMTQKKQPVSRILIYFDEDGNYFVNEKQRGKI